VNSPAKVVVWFRSESQIVVAEFMKDLTEVVAVDLAGVQHVLRSVLHHVETEGPCKPPRPIVPTGDNHHGNDRHAWGFHLHLRRFVQKAMKLWVASVEPLALVLHLEEGSVNSRKCSLLCDDVRREIDRTACRSDVKHLGRVVADGGEELAFGEGVEERVLACLPDEPNWVAFRCASPRLMPSGQEALASGSSSYRGSAPCSIRAVPGYDGASTTGTRLFETQPALSVQLIAGPGDEIGVDLRSDRWPALVGDASFKLARRNRMLLVEDIEDGLPREVEPVDGHSPSLAVLRLNCIQPVYVLIKDAGVVTRQIPEPESDVAKQEVVTAFIGRAEVKLDFRNREVGSIAAVEHEESGVTLRIVRNRQSCTEAMLEVPVQRFQAASPTVSSTPGRSMDSG